MLSAVKARGLAPPDFVGVGAQDAGGLRWLRLLAAHPAIVVPEPRELHFFDKFRARPMLGRDIARYRRHFAHPPRTIAGEWTSRYMYDFWTPPLLHRAAPEARLLVMVRDPVDRFRAALRDQHGTAGSRRAALAIDEAVQRGRYAAQLRGLLALYPAERILVLQYERCLGDPAGEYARTLRFLGVEDTVRPRALERTRDEPEAGAAEERDIWAQRAHDLQAVLSDDVRDLCTLVADLDLGLWPNFTHLAGGARRAPGVRPCPEPEPGPPDFVGVGTQRSGTTWWFGLLCEHPAIHLPRPGHKELHFFDQFSRQPMCEIDIAHYHSWFPRRAGAITGEWTPRYMHDPWTLELLYRAAPDARVLVMLRDPVERFRSGVAHEAGAGGRTSLTMMTDAAERGRYATQLRRLLDVYPAEQVLVLQYERCRDDPFGQFARTLRFLGVDDGFAPEEPTRPRGRSTKSHKRELWPELREALRVALEHEVRDLVPLVPDFDLALWPNFAHLASERSASPPSPVAAA